MRVWGVTKDQREFAEFYAASWDECLRIVMISVGRRDVSEDLVAEAFTRAWAHWPKVRRLAAPRALVIRVALNAHVSLWRRRRREVALGSDDTAAPATANRVLDSSPTPANVARAVVTIPPGFHRFYGPAGDQ